MNESKNTNCLEGFRCPSCGWTHDFIIWTTSAFRVTDEGTEHQGSVEWGPENHCACGKCPHEDIVQEFTRPPLPPDPEGMNDKRALHVGAALNAYMEETGSDLETAVRDMLTDLRHYCDRHRLDIAAEDGAAQRRYEEEICPLDPNTDAIDREENE